MQSRRWHPWSFGRQSFRDPESHEITTTNHNGPKNESPDHMTRFVQSVFAIDGYVANEWPGFDAYLNILKEQAQHFEIDGFVAFWRFLGSSSPPNFEATLKFLTVVASVWRETERSDLSIDETLAAVLVRYQADHEHINHETKNTGRQAIFSTIT